MELVDAHCHLERADYPDATAVIERARAVGVVHAVVVGQLQKEGGFGDALALAAAHPDFFTATLGIHPHDAGRATADDWAFVERACATAQVAAVGETGLDYYYDHSEREEQRRAFRRHCQLAAQLGKPLVVHVRDAHRDCRTILEETGVRRGMIHCFTGDPADASAYLAMGFCLSISGIATYKKSEEIQQAVRECPLERLLVETDSPYLAPVPHRGKKNEPAFVVETARKVAELKGVSLDEVASATTRNAAVLLGLALPGR